MATRSLIGFAVATAAATVSLATSTALPTGRTPEGRAPTPMELMPSVEAAFSRESYAPGATARLTIFTGRETSGCKSSAPGRSEASRVARAPCMAFP